MRTRTGRQFAAQAGGHSCLPASMPTMCPRKWAGERFRATSDREDGRFFAPLRMTCFAITNGEMCPSHVRRYCHPEEALSAVPGTGRPAGRRRISCSIGSSGRDLHVSIPEWQHVRLLRHRILSDRLLFAHPARQHNHPPSCCVDSTMYP